MDIERRRVLATIASLSAAAPYGSLLAADPFPTKPIRLVVPFIAGGSNDIVARYLGQRLSERVRQSVVVDNKAGANSIIGSQFVAEAPADGHTLLIISNAFTTNPAAYKKLPYDPIKDFTPICTIGTGPNVIAVWPGLGVNSISELIALAKTTPLNYASSGLGGVHHFTGELFKAAAGMEMTHIAFRGAGQGLLAVMGGQVQVLVNTVVSALPNIRSGKLKALAVDSPTRISILPDVPSLSETFPGYEGNPVWWAILGPANMAPPVVDYLNREFNAILKEPEVVNWLRGMSSEPLVAPPSALAKRLENEIRKYQTIATKSNIKIE